MADISDLKCSNKPDKLLTFPDNALFDRIIAKDKIFQAAKASQKIRQIFQKQVQRIRCSYELTEDKLNLKSCTDVPKIIIIQIITKKETLDVKVLEAVDKAFGVPVFFQISYPGKVQYCACFRRRSESNREDWVMSSYFCSSLLDNDSQFTQMPVALDMKGLYDELLKIVIPDSAAQKLSIAELVEKTEEINKTETEIEKTRNRFKSQKQFNRKVELNQKVNKLEDKLKILSGEG